MSESDASSAAGGGAMSEAQRRAAARKAKILARGGAGLAKLATTARGEEGSLLYDTNIPSRSSTPAAAAATGSGPRSNSAGNTSSPFGAPLGADDANANAMLAQYMSMLGQGNAAGRSDRDMRAQMELMQSLLSGGGGVGSNMSSSTAGALTGVDPTADPPSPTIAASALGPAPDLFGLGGGAGGGSGLFPPGFDPSTMFANAGHPGSGAGFDSSQQAKPSRAAKIFPLLHVLATIALWAFACFVWEPSLGYQTAAADSTGEKAREILVQGAGKLLGWKGLGSGMGKWAMLRGDRGGLPPTLAGSSTIFEPLPIFWAFTTVELILQTTRLMIFKRPPQAPSIVSNILPFLPPHYARGIITLLRYASLGMQVWKDGCLLIFLLGMTAVLA